MQKNGKSKWRVDPFDILTGILPSLFVLAISIYYFTRLNMDLNMLVFFISPVFITYFVVRSVRMRTRNRWLDWLSIIQFSILFLIGFHAIMEYVQKQNFQPVINASIILSLTAFILTFVLCIALYCFLYKYERIALSKRLYEKQIDVAYHIYRDCYQLFQEVKNFISFSYKLTSLPPQEKSAKDQLQKKYTQLLSVQKNILAKKQAEVEVCKFYLSKPLQRKVNRIFQLYHQLFQDCPTEPEMIQQYEQAIQYMQKDLENSLHNELGVDFLYKEIQMVIKINKKENSTD